MFSSSVQRLRKRTSRVSKQYRAMLFRSLHTGQFLRWIEGGNA
jgi:hypothetical protein